jgi:hypothetical protein
MPTIRPSSVRFLVTVCPHGSVRAGGPLPLRAAAHGHEEAGIDVAPFSAQSGPPRGLGDPIVALFR